VNQLQVERQVRMPKEHLPGFVGRQVLPGQRHVHTGFIGVGRPDALIPVAMPDHDPSPVLQTPAERRNMLTHRLLRLVRDPEGSWALSVKRQQLGLRDDLNVLCGDITLRQVRVVVAGNDEDPQGSEVLVTAGAYSGHVVHRFQAKPSTPSFTAPWSTYSRASNRPGGSSLVVRYMSAVKAKGNGHIPCAHQHADPPG